MFFDCTQQGCGKVFNCKKALKEHERTHNQDRPFKCELCDQTFTQYSSLQKHARVHDKRKPFKCSNSGCNQAFSQVSNLIRHQRIHTGEKPYECEICGKQFASGSNLKQHVQIHDRQDARNQYKCIFEGCEKTYLYPSSLKKHYTVTHKDEYEQYLKERQIETCGFHLKSQEPFSNNLKINNIRDQTLESQRLFQDGNDEQKSLASLNFIRNEDRLPLTTYQKMQQSLGDVGPINPILGKRNSAYQSLDEYPSTKRQRLEPSSYNKQMPTQPNSQTLPDRQADQLSKSADDNSLHLTCHMYFINQQNNQGQQNPDDKEFGSKRGQEQTERLINPDTTTPQVRIEPGQQPSCRLPSFNLATSIQQKEQDLNQVTLKHPQLEKFEAQPINQQSPQIQPQIQNDMKQLTSLMSFANNEAVRNIHHQAHPQQYLQNMIDPASRHHNRQYQSHLIQNLQVLLDQQNSNKHPDVPQQLTAFDHLNKQRFQLQSQHGVQSPSMMNPYIHSQLTAQTLNQYNQMDRRSNNSHSILSPSVVIRRTGNGQNQQQSVFCNNQNHGSANSFLSNYSAIKSSQFKYKAQQLNKPDSISQVNDSHSADSERKDHSLSQQQQNFEAKIQNISRQLSVQDVDAGEQQSHNNNIEQSLFKSAITQDVEDINNPKKELNQLILQPRQKSSAFQQVLPSSSYLQIPGHNGIQGLRRSFSDSASEYGGSLCGDSMNPQFANPLIQPKSSFFFNHQAQNVGGLVAHDSMDSLSKGEQMSLTTKQQQFMEDLSNNMISSNLDKENMSQENNQIGMSNQSKNFLSGVKDNIE